MTAALAESPFVVEAPDDVEPESRLVDREETRRGMLSGRGDDERVRELVDAPVVLGARRPENFTAQIEARSTSSRASLRAHADMAMREAGSQRAVVLRCDAGTLTLALVTVLDPERPIESPSDIPLPVLHWSLAPASGDATARADVLDLLRTLHEGAEISITNCDEGARTPIGKLSGPSAHFDAELERDWAFVTDVATLEEWADMALPMPVEIDAEQVARIHQAAEGVRNRAVPVTFREEITGLVDRDAPIEGATDLELNQEFSVLVFGYDVPLGMGHARIPVAVTGHEPIATDPHHMRARFRPLPGKESATFVLSPPPERLRLRRTLGAGEQPEAHHETPNAWTPTWSEGEREVDSERRDGRKVHFVSEDAFYEWLTQPDAAPTS